jgi:hypothetical protein
MGFLSENWGTILVGAAVLAVVVMNIVRLMSKKRRGQSSCGCGCDHCASSDMCHKK